MFRKYKLRKRKEQSRAEIKEKWGGQNGFRRSYPNDWSELEPDLKEAIIKHCSGYVCEIGCGPGRIAQLLPPTNYVGVDINSFSIQKARKKLPSHNFYTIQWDDDYPDADTYLLFTVLFHIPDNELEAILSRIPGKIIIIEAMGRWLRDYDRDNNYFRDPKEYRDGFKELLFIHFSSKRFPYFVNMQVLR